MPRGPERIRTAEGKLNGVYGRVREARELAGLTQSQLAARIGTQSGWIPSREDVNRVERGTRIVSDLECKVIATALDCDAAWLVFGDQTATRPLNI